MWEPLPLRYFYITLMLLLTMMSKKLLTKKSGWSERWRSVPLQHGLLMRVRRVVEAGIGYRNVTEFVNDAVRRRLEEVEAFYGLTKAPARPPAGVDAEQGGPIGGMSPASSGEKIERGDING